MKKEVFLERAFAIHGDKFDYSLVPAEFGWKDKVIVMCEVHGQFLITAANHISNRRGCPACGAVGRSINNRDSLEDVILQVKTKHPLYNVDYTSYVDKNTVLKVNCEHGHDFSSSARDLLRSKYMCAVCALKGRGLSKRKSLDDFLIKTAEVHKGKYDYSKMVFCSYQEKVEIVCATHGSFWQAPTVHIKGHGCPRCAATLNSKSRQSVPEWVYSDPNVIPKIETYKSTKDSMVFTCSIHGEVRRVLSSSLKGKSLCPKCNREQVANTFKTSNEDFIIKAQCLFPEYDYSKVDYDGVSKYVTITCDKGHMFKQKAGNLLTGYGCPSCSRTGFSYDKKGYLYILKIDNIYGKIGISNKYQSRIKHITSSAKVDVELIKLFTFEQGVIAKDIETFLLSSKDLQFSVVSKCDLPDGYTETFHLRDLEIILDKIEKYIESI